MWLPSGIIQRERVHNRLAVSFWHRPWVENGGQYLFLQRSVQSGLQLVSGIDSGFQFGSEKADLIFSSRFSCIHRYIRFAHQCPHLLTVIREGGDSNTQADFSFVIPDDERV
ncbi:MAG: hypothetical protein R3C11_00765 [Planctomycetaceae bacterium]